MAKASRMILLFATMGLFGLSIIMLLSSESEMMAIPLIGMAILGGFGYMMFDADAPKKPNSTPGVVHQKSPLHDLDTHKEELPDLTQGEYDLPIL